MAAVRRCSVTHQYTVNFAPLLADMSAELGCCTLWDGETEWSCREAQIHRPRHLLLCHAHPSPLVIKGPRPVHRR
jgi:uracil DNA glycosylase